MACYTVTLSPQAHAFYRQVAERMHQPMEQVLSATLEKVRDILDTLPMEGEWMQ
nr:hypothetical protein [bacterium]